MARCVNLREKCLHEHELQLSDYTMYEKNIRLHTVIMSDGAGKVTYHENKFCKEKIVNNIFLPEILSFGRKYFYTL